MAKRRQSKEDGVTRIAVELPLGEGPPEGHERNEALAGHLYIEGAKGLHVDVRLPPDAAAVFLRLRNGLRETTARLDDGRPVWNNADTMRWLLSAVASGI